VKDLQAVLYEEDYALSKKERVAKYKKAVKNFDKVIKVGSHTNRGTLF
jgi:hypothetical protein